MVDDVFYSEAYIKKNIQYVDNLSLTKNHIIRAKQALPELLYEDAVNKSEYNRLCTENPFKRDIQQELID